MSIQIFVLIMALGGATSQSGIATITHEFNSFEACEAAREHILKSVTTGHNYAIVVAQGCFKK